MTLPARQVHAMTEEEDFSRIDFAVRGDRYRFWAKKGSVAHKAFWTIANKQRVKPGEPRRSKKSSRSDRMNRRETFRVLSSGDEEPPTIQGQIQVGQEPPVPFEGQLVDFSFGGCAFAVGIPVAHADDLQLMITAAGESKLISAEVVYERKLRRMNGYRIGVRFNPVNSAEVKILRNAWMKMQRSVCLLYTSPSPRD